jgi:hypothetical protein
MLFLKQILPIIKSQSDLKKFDIVNISLEFSVT